MGLALLVAFAAGLPAGADPPATTTREAVRDAVAKLTPQELEMLRLTNEYRASIGVPTLLISARLQRESRWYAADMAAHDGFTVTHIDSLGRDLWKRLEVFNYVDDDAAQNSGTGSPSGRAMFDGFKASVPHDRTLRGARFRVTSVAMAENPAFPARFYWAASFGTVNDRPPAGDLIAVPARPTVAVRGCRGGRALVCRPGRPVVVRSVAPSSPREIDVQSRRRGRWSTVRRIGASTARLTLRPGELLRVRAVAFPEQLEGEDRGTWKVLRGGRP